MAGQPVGQEAGGVALDDHLVQSMCMARVYKDNSARVNSLSWHRTADLLATAGDDDVIHLYDTARGGAPKTVNVRKYGAACVAFTHAENAVLHASTKGAEALVVRYLSLHDNAYLRYFRGHTRPITALSVSPVNDLFLSAAQDREVRLWDLRVQACQALLRAPTPATAAFDEQGLVFCVALHGGVLKLYDVRSFGQGPFETFVVASELNSAAGFSAVRFSPDGRSMLAVAESRVVLLDAFNGQVLTQVSNAAPEGSPPLSACFSPDSKYFLAGCQDRAIRVWSTADGCPLVATWTGHAGVPACVSWCPSRMLAASACSALALWAPPLQALTAKGYNFPEQTVPQTM